MGTNVTPTFTHIYLAMLEKEWSKNVQTTQNLFGQFIFKSFGIFKGSKNEIEYWAEQVNNLQECARIKPIIGYLEPGWGIWTLIFSRFYKCGKFDIWLRQKEENKFLYLPAYTTSEFFGHESEILQS